MSAKRPSKKHFAEKPKIEFEWRDRSQSTPHMQLEVTVIFL